MQKIKGTVYICFDASGSTNDLIRSKYKSIYKKYQKIYTDVKTISFTVKAEFKNIEDIINSKGQGGTYLSSALKLVLPEIIVNKNDTKLVIAGDGDIWEEDVESSMKLIHEALRHCEVDYYELTDKDASYLLSNRLQSLDSFVIWQIHYAVNNLNVFKIGSKYDINGELLLKKVAVYAVTHKVGGKEYLFVSDQPLSKGMVVVCDTKYGKTYGYIESKRYMIMTNDEIEKYKKCYDLYVVRK